MSPLPLPPRRGRGSRSPGNWSGCPGRVVGVCAQVALGDVADCGGRFAEREAAAADAEITREPVVATYCRVCGPVLPARGLGSMPLARRGCSQPWLVAGALRRRRLARPRTIVWKPRTRLR